jgi:hypothetical protein
MSSFFQPPCSEPLAVLVADRDLEAWHHCSVLVLRQSVLLHERPPLAGQFSGGRQDLSHANSHDLVGRLTPDQMLMAAAGAGGFSKSPHFGSVVFENEQS